MAVQQSQLMGPAPPVSWRFYPLPTHIFGLLPDACSSESSDTELEQKEGLQQIEEERKLRHQQQYEDYRNFLEEQKHQFYLQQEAQLYQEHEHTNEYIQEQCHQNGSFPTCSNGYVQKQYIQDEPLENRNLNGCIQEQEKYNLSGYIQEHEIYQLSGHLQEQSQNNQEYQFAVDADQCHNQQDQYQFAAQQYVDNDLQYLGEEGCSRLSEQCYSTDVPVGQAELVGQQEEDEGGRLFCVVGPTGSACAAMSTLVGASEGEY
jgi:hypothetical protein